MNPILLVLLALSLPWRPASICVSVPFFPWRGDGPPTLLVVPGDDGVAVVPTLEYLSIRTPTWIGRGARAQKAIAKLLPTGAAADTLSTLSADSWTSVAILPWADNGECERIPWRWAQTWTPPGDTIVIRAYTRPKDEWVDGEPLLDAVDVEWELGPAGYFNWGHRRDSVVPPNALTVGEYARYYSAFPTRVEWDKDPEEAYRALEQQALSLDPALLRYPIPHVLRWAWRDLRDVQAAATVRGLSWPRVPGGADSLLDQAWIDAELWLGLEEGEDSTIRRWQSDFPCPRKHAPFVTPSGDAPPEAVCAIALAALDATSNDPRLVQTAKSVAVFNAEPIRDTYDDWWAVEIDRDAGERLLVVLLHRSGRAVQYSLLRPRFYGTRLPDDRN